MQTHTSIIKSLSNTPMSLADLLNKTEVSLPTLRKAVQELTEKNWVQVVGQAETTGGRPAMLFGLDNHFYAIIGVHLQLPGMRLIVADLNGDVLQEQAIIQEEVPTPNQVIDIIVETIALLRREHPERELLGIGIAAPGYTDPVSGDIISVGRVEGWRNFPICSRLQAAVGLPTKITNDVDAMAIAEIRSANRPIDKNLIYLGLDEGIKASIVLNGSIYTGPFGNVGIISTRLLAVHDYLPPEIVNSSLTIHNINKLFDGEISQLSQADQRAYASILEETNPRQRVERIFAEQDLPVCVTVLGIVNRVIGIVAANLIHLIQPDTLVLGGVLSTMPANSYRKLEAEIRQYLPSLISNYLLIQPAFLSSPNAAAIGATHQFLQGLLVDMNKYGFDIGV
ncbi:ROK family protein [Phototrophicus methaneseepsis]|uniref:ROK family protein n=1 Tax=Phototrophicus methaneseepsis TaxID=2710758 RepID=A0A7S8EBQ4_9CHLR|nr:ROK family protein [Phototrophicus methaneseepsis]QPC84033.1 ROK family protein [Phototrophicus methaneseepsis]